MSTARTASCSSKRTAACRTRARAWRSASASAGGAARWTDSSVMSSTPGSSATCGSKSWLGARSMTVSGRSAPTRQRARAAASMRAPEPLQPMTRSAPATAAGSCRAETARPPRAATKASARPEWEKTEMSEYLRVLEQLRHAPGVSAGTEENGRRPGDPGPSGPAAARSRATAAMDLPALPSAVCAPTSLAVRDAAWNSLPSRPLAVPAACASARARRTWPATSRSPTTTESRPAATAKRCSTAAAPRSSSKRAARWIIGSPEQRTTASRMSARAASRPARDGSSQ